MRTLRNWREIAAEAMHEAQAAPVTADVTPRSSADVLADLRTELQPVRMSSRVRVKVNALLDELSTHEDQR